MKRLICISGSNTKLIGHNSTSVKVGNIIEKIVHNQKDPNIEVEVIPLMEYDLKTCILCGSCNSTGRCSYDGEFNRLLTQIEEADGIVFIIPHYSPIPAKVIMLFEKLNEIMYSGWIKNPEFKSAWNNKPVAVIGHGGMVETKESLSYYYDQLVTRVADTLRSFDFQVIGVEEEKPNGVCFGLKDDSCLVNREGAVFPDIRQDWEMIEERVEPLIHKMLNVML